MFWLIEGGGGVVSGRIYVGLNELLMDNVGLSLFGCPWINIDQSYWGRVE